MDWYAFVNNDNNNDNNNNNNNDNDNNNNNKVSTWDNEVTLCCNYLQVTLEQGVVPISSPRDHEVPGWRPAGASLSHGQEGVFSFGRQPSY